MTNPNQNKSSLQDLALLYNVIQEMDSAQNRLRKTFARGCTEAFKEGQSSLGEISKVVGISRQRIAQIISKDDC